MRLKLFTIAALCAFAVCGCGGKKDEPKGESTGEVIHSYTSTLKKTQDKAQDVSVKMGERTAEQNKPVNE